MVPGLGSKYIENTISAAFVYSLQSPPYPLFLSTSNLLHSRPCLSLRSDAFPCHRRCPLRAQADRKDQAALTKGLQDWCVFPTAAESFREGRNSFWFLLSGQPACAAGQHNDFQGPSPEELKGQAKAQPSSTCSNWASKRLKLRQHTERRLIPTPWPLCLRWPDQRPRRLALEDL